MHPTPLSRLRRAGPFLAVVLLCSCLLLRHLAGRSLVPLDLLPLFPPWKRAEVYAGVRAHNPLLDSLQQYYPRRVYATDELRAGRLPLWNPSVYGGSPFHATQQGGVLYPPAWLGLGLDAERQFVFTAWLHLCLAGIGMLLLLLRLGLEPLSATVGGAGFALNGYMVAWAPYPNVTLWTLAWLPLALYGSEGWIRGGGLRSLAGTGAILGLCLLGGHLQSAAYVLLFWVAWTVWRALASGRGPRGAVIAAGAPLALGVGLAMGQLLPAMEFVARSDRADRVPWHAIQQGGMPLAQLWNLLLPRLFGDETLPFGTAPHWIPSGGRAQLAYVERTFYPGIALLVLACGVAGLAREMKEHRQLAAFTLAVTVAGVLLAMATPLYWPLWRFAPGFGQFTAPARIVAVAAPALAILAGLGAQALAAGESRQRAGKAVCAGALLVGLLAVAGHYVYAGAAPADRLLTIGLMHGGSPADLDAALEQGRRTLEATAARDLAAALGFLILLLAAGGVAAARRSPVPVAVPGLLALVAVASDLFLFGWRFLPAADAAPIHPLPDLGLPVAQAVPVGRFLSPGPPGEEENFRRRLPSNLPSLFGAADISGSDSFVTRRYREWEAAVRAASGGRSAWAAPGSPALRSAAVRYYLTEGRALLPPLRSLGSQGLYEDPAALPYARLHARAIVPGIGELPGLIGRADRDLETALVSPMPVPESRGRSGVTPAAVTREGGGRLRLRLSAGTGGVLVVSEQFDPGWKASSRGQHLPIGVADGLFLAVPVPARPGDAGDREVHLSYAPASFRAGLFVSLLYLAAGAMAFASSRPRRRAACESVV